MSSAAVIVSGSLRMRNSNSGCGEFYGVNEVKLCPSVMSPETKRLLPPTTETVPTKPFPIRGELQCSFAWVE